jgi:hypothetical protein
MEFVYVEWYDSAEMKNGDSQWMDDKELSDNIDADKPCRQAGWVVKEAEKYIVLSSLIASIDDESYQYGLTFKIPKSLITKKVIIENKLFK